MAGIPKINRTILMDGTRYYADRPKDCKKCFFWKNRKVGCILGKGNCYYLAEAMKSEREKECETCCYSRNGTCASACCYKKLSIWLHAKQAREKAEKEGVKREKK